nr:putative nuclease HARBI1 isoform X2 [Misgurnus anguillicaudatus]
MAYLALLEDLANRALRRERVFKDRADLLGESTEWLLSRYRFPRNILLDLCRDLGPTLERETQRTKAIPVHIQLLSTLGFLATGTFQREVGDICGISQPSLSRIMPAVLDAIIVLAPNYIQFPYRNPQQAEVKRGFHAIARFSNIIGAIDCTHIAIKAPSTNEFNYVNRKGFHSINVQVICDANLSLLNVVARWPGGTHDSFIMQNSSVGLRLQEGAIADGWLIGDQGYPLKPWLMTPLTNPTTQQEQNYNRAHARSRGTVERAIGLLKGRWLGLSNTGGTLQYRPEKVCKIIMACCVLHNLAIRQGVPLQGPPRPDGPMPDAGFLPPPNAAAIQARQRIIQTF